MRRYHYVYIAIHAGHPNPIKIGCSIWPQFRVSALQTEYKKAPIKIAHICEFKDSQRAFFVERYVKRALSHKLASGLGSEWFNTTIPNMKRCITNGVKFLKSRRDWKTIIFSRDGSIRNYA